MVQIILYRKREYKLCWRSPNSKECNHCWKHYKSWQYDSTH